MHDFDSPEVLKTVDQLETGNYGEALESLLPLAEVGNPRARCNLASPYPGGLGVEMDRKRAVALSEIVPEQKYSRRLFVRNCIQQLGDNLHYRSKR